MSQVTIAIRWVDEKTTKQVRSSVLIGILQTLGPLIHRTTWSGLDSNAELGVSFATLDVSMVLLSLASALTDSSKALGTKYLLAVTGKHHIRETIALTITEVPE